MVIVTDFVGIINDLHQLFQLDLANWENLITKFVEHFLAFYVNLNNIFVFSIQSYLAALLEFTALGVGTFSEIQVIYICNFSFQSFPSGFYYRV